jgi:hypothetical protein
MRPKIVYLVLAVLGGLVPYVYFLPWLLEHGLDLPLFFHELHANPVSEFFAADVILSAAVMLTFLIFERRRLSWSWWLPVLGLMIFGVSVALPLLLYLRETPRQGAG